MGKENGEESGRKGQASQESGRIFVKEGEGADKFVPGNCLVAGVGDGEMSARHEASAKRQEKKDDGEDE